ncbi:hypothetical protein Cni_G23194 [Canna indica]|uniref:Embryonic stem cell-specific 5-hydroxymethylcytosine-binding protein n=1 Tax=Canna indica TaxID=4628 RepID=A0AAQ3QK85_9LILI|nr:hypothetical protein Cni_G23194 [Canna indica]
MCGRARCTLNPDQVARACGVSAGAASVLTRQIDRFYEWKKDGSRKQPYYIHFKDQRPLVFAALYDTWKNSEGDVLYTFTILTTSSSTTLQWLHDRMPVILGDKGSVDAWLNNAIPKVETVLRPYEDTDLVWYPVMTEVGKSSFDGPYCIKEIQLKSAGENSISKFFTKKTVGKNQLEVERSKCSKVSPKIREASDGIEYDASGVEKLNLPKESPRADSFEDPIEDPECNTDETADKANIIKKSAFPEVIGTKRNTKELAPDTGETFEKDSSPLKKARNEDKKQSSLLSYFGSADRTVKCGDLETFKLIGSAGPKVCLEYLCH